MDTSHHHFIRKARQGLYFLRWLRKYFSPQCCYDPSTPGLWSRCSLAAARSGTAKLCAERTSRTALPCPACRTSTSGGVQTGPGKMITDIHRPGNGLLKWLPSGRRLRSCKDRTERLRRSFFPQVIRTLTSDTHTGTTYKFMGTL